ncbi:pectate lyase family protein [Algibacter amylolyticus]|uniref:pectate lyase family protein n=1 Tax=Algibacter amylolyticus TaxID=1608400 RepID=UPI0017A399BF|nr:pectate lyase [Algibacter amylolyticus]MBB5267214.1 pectate lyase [Algibacter amylolyticus]
MRKTIFTMVLSIIIGCASSKQINKPVNTTSNNAISNVSQLAFPTAEGYGKYAKGGRGGEVYEVTNLNDGGEGSLRAAIEAPEPRTVVFKVSGTITLESPLRIKHPFITIAGQTAPGDGICIRKWPLIIEADHVIIRYIKVRFGNESGSDSDAISSRFVNNLILDHVSASWSVDETMSIYHCKNVTVQWCIISESLFNSNHIKGIHGFGGIWGSNYSTYHHNLLAHHSSRNVRFASGSGNTDYRNNVIYNWGYQSAYGGENQQKNNDGTVNPEFSFSNINMVANYYKPGPATALGNVQYRIVSPSRRDVTTDYGTWYVAENFMERNPVVSANNWDGGVQPQGGNSDIEILKSGKPWPAMAIKQHTAQEAYKLVLNNAGATLPKRDAVDTRIVNDVRKGVATFEGTTYKQKKDVPDPTKNSGIIDTPNDVGGWPELKSTSAPTDTDKDGMPDKWEIKNGLNPKDPSDRNIIGPDGYPMLEVYLNGIKPVIRL